MLKNFLITIIRNFNRNKFYTVLNVIGLSVGLICAILIVLFIQEELSYDKYNVNHKRIVRLGSDFTLNGKRDRVATSPMPFGPTFKQEFPEVEDFVRIHGSGRQQFRYEDTEFYEERIAYIDSSVFKVFSYNLIQGNPDKALTEPYTIVLNETLAKKYFGDEDPIGKVLIVGENSSYTVTGVMEDVPRNSHFKFRGFYSMKTLESIRGAEEFNSTEPITFWSFSNYTFLLLKENTNIDALQSKFPLYYNKYMKALGDQLGVEYKLIVQKLADIHLKSDLEWDAPTGNIKYIFILSAIAFFILSIAGINYMNMATARSSKRAREVGVRKVVGAHRDTLIRQFLMESLSLTILALMIALIVVELILPLFNSLVDKDLSLSISESPEILVFSVVLALVLGIVSGSYPAFYLSSFRPATILKGSTIKGKAGGLLRKLLVISQFTVSAIMISGTIVVGVQLNYMNNKDMGFSKEDVLVSIVRDSLMRTKIEPLKDELRKSPNINSIATSNTLIGFDGSKTVHLYEGEEGMEQYALNFSVIDFDYLDMMQMKIMQGRKFNRKIASDTSSAFIVNQSAARKFNWNEKAVGKKLQLGVELEGEEDDDGIMKGEVVGVVADFHYRPLRENIEPINFLVSENPRHRRVLYVKLNQENREESIKYIESVWNKFSPNMAFNYFFLDDRLRENYDSEVRLTWIFSIFSLLSILIASLGLFGLSSFMAEQRTKELGIRKVLGASVKQLVNLLTKEFVRLIFIANVLAIPITYWAMNSWLNDFSYRIQISWWIFLLTLIVSLVIGVFTVSWQSYRAASADPVNAIKYE
ncbi:ABC transporter permease [Marinifilum sp. D714]|uniref:ABC transporter permease n=1 Tax=Marinifilum sp. D714 TaxID=2937523 RepID=UPI0027CFCC07|nr:ABC transporter permease [Marinifilum sp. D714]MDQ2177610.1 ABC transporter permease [Marinifilum sp. D714]